MKKEDVENIINYFHELVLRNIEYNPIILNSQADNNDESGNKVELSEQLFGYVSDYFFGTNNFIKVIPDMEFMSTGGKQLFHGFLDFDYGARELVHWNYHYGRGISGGGLYTTNNVEEAYDYTRQTRDQMGDYEKILPIKVIPRLVRAVDNDWIGTIAANINEDYSKFSMPSHIRDKLDIIKSAIDKIEDEDEKYKLTSSICFNCSILAVMLGFNYLKNPKKYGAIDNDIILDRNIVIAPESIARNFLKKSKNFKDGVLHLTSLAEINADIEKTD